MSTCPPLKDHHLTPWVESRFNTACDVLERILNEIERDDSGAKDCKSEALSFPKFAELESLYGRVSGEWSPAGILACAGSPRRGDRGVCGFQSPRLWEWFVGIDLGVFPRVSVG